jgi:hypothetical protein
MYNSSKKRPGASLVFSVLTLSIISSFTISLHPTSSANIVDATRLSDIDERIKERFEQRPTICIGTCPTGPPGPPGQIEDITSFMVWQDDTDSPEHAIQFKRSVIFDHDSKTLAGGISDSNIESDPDIAVSGNNIRAVWTHDSLGRDVIGYRESINGGLTFEFIRTISSSTEIARSPSIATSGNNVYVVWTDGDSIFFRRSTAGGASFRPIETLSSGGGSTPSIATSGNNVYLVWQDNTIAEILYRRSIDNGAAFGPSIKLSSHTFTIFQDPQAYLILQRLAITYMLFG